MFFLKFCHFFRAKLVQKVKNYVFHLNYYETEKIKKTKLVWHQILHHVTHLFQNLTNFDRDITKSRISSFSTFSNFCPIASSKFAHHCFVILIRILPFSSINSITCCIDQKQGSPCNVMIKITNHHYNLQSTTTTTMFGLIFMVVQLHISNFRMSACPAFLHFARWEMYFREFTHFSNLSLCFAAKTFSGPNYLNWNIYIETWTSSWWPFQPMWQFWESKKYFCCRFWFDFQLLSKFLAKFATQVRFWWFTKWILK